jgi:hypothetical protein
MPFMAFDLSLVSLSIILTISRIEEVVERFAIPRFATTQHLTLGRALFVHNQEGW